MSKISLLQATKEPEASQAVAAVREFNRFYTNVIGLLREGLLDTPYSLTEARVIFELARWDQAEVTKLRRSLDANLDYEVSVVWVDGTGARSKAFDSRLGRVPMGDDSLLDRALYGLRWLLQRVTAKTR